MPRWNLERQESQLKTAGVHSAVSCEEHSETDNVTSIELQRNRRLLHFSDGTMEELSGSDNEAELDVPDKTLDGIVDEKELPMATLLRCKACKAGSNILAGIDYIGSGLALFLGITSPKYASERDYFKRNKSQVDDCNKSFEHR